MYLKVEKVKYWQDLNTWGYMSLKICYEEDGRTRRVKCLYEDRYRYYEIKKSTNLTIFFIY